MKFLERAGLAALLTLVVAAVAGLYLTSATPQLSPPQTPPAAAGAASLDRRYLDQARRLGATATTTETQSAAKAALAAADRELDLAYAYALQVAAVEPAPESPAIRAIQERIAQIQSAIHDRRTSIDQIERGLTRLQGTHRAVLENQLAVSQAELNLLQETLADAKDDLAQAGGDPQSRLEALKAQHEAASRAADTFRFPPLQGQPTFGSLRERWLYWRSTVDTERAIEQARRDASLAAAALQQQRDALTRHIDTEQAHRTALSGNPAIAAIQHLSSDQIRLRLLERRGQSMKDLASAYATWESSTHANAQAVLHGLIAGGLWAVLIVGLGVFGSRLLERVFAGLSLERKQKATLQAVLRLTVRLFTLVILLMLAFGRPSQLSTVIGLASAGLAVALQDFLLSFLGWFVLMGRHGIRVGDWVEINANAFSGVRGEVVEITLFRTVLLETGNWTETGHLTGREVAFMNMYAVNGYFFNFTTAGQWLWDELQVAIPASRNPYPLITDIQAIVARATDAQAKDAEHEWQRISHRYNTRSFSARPAVNLKLSDRGVIAVLRYIVRADERIAMQQRLNHEVVKLFHHGEGLVRGEVTTGPASAPAATG